MAGDKQLQYINHLRGFAILLIVAIHCRTSFAWGNAIEERVWFSLLVYGTIVFVFISGFLFQHVHREQFSFRPYFQRKLKYVVLPYLFVSIPAIVNKLWFDAPEPWQTDFYRSLPDLGKAVYMLVTGKHIGPFWFIPMIFLIYLLAPLLIALDRNKYFYRFLFPVIFIGGLFLHDFGHNTSVFMALLYFLPVYMLGMWASRNATLVTGLTWTQLSPLIIVYLVIFALEVSGYLAIGKTYGFAETPPDNAYLFNFGKLKMLALCLIATNLFARMGSGKIPALQLLAEYSFGIYFVHLYVIRATEKVIRMVLKGLTFNTVTFTVYFFVIVVVSVGVIWVVKKLFGGKSRYVVGS